MAVWLMRAGSHGEYEHKFLIFMVSCRIFPF